MKLILLSLNHAPEKTGIGKYQGEIAQWFAQRGHDVTIVTAPPYYPEWKISEGYSGWWYKREKLDGTEIYRVPLYVPKNPSGTKRMLHLLSFAITSFPVMLWLALRKRPDAIMMTEPPLMAAPATLFSGLIGGARTYLHVQDFEVDAAFELGLLKKPWLKKCAFWLERKALNAFHCVSTISPNMRKKLLDKGLPESKTALVQNWANTNMFDPAKGEGKWKEQLKQDPNTILVVYSGNLGRKQGLECIVEAALLLKDEHHLKFVVSGDGAGREDMIKAAEGLNNITFLPLQPFDDFVHLMIAADIHLLPQKAGAADLVMPSKLGNILASARPVIVGAAEGTQVHEAVQGCGLSVEPENANAFVKAIKILANDKKLREAMGEQAAKRAERDWSKQSLLLKMEEMLSQ